MPRGDYWPAIEVDARAATFTSVIVRSTAGINIRGGIVKGEGGGSAVMIDTAKRILVSGMVVSGARVGITATKSTDVEITGNRLDGVRSDGINLAMVQRVHVAGNQCINFHPVLDIFDAAGKLVKGGDHPDCIQGWSRLGYPPTSDILIEGNTSYGVTQGIWFGDPGQGGYDRITIRNNDLTLGYFQGIAVHEGRGTVIQNNRVMPVPGARLLGGNRGPVRPWIVTPGSNDASACGNVVAAQASRYGTEKCQ
jgi:nitrous oxidase accessory protein NosD